MHNRLLSSTPLRALKPRRVLLASAMTLALTACNPSTKWGPITSYYDGQMRVSASGTASVLPTSQVQNNIVLSDTRQDGNSVYATTYWWFDSYHCDADGNCSTTYHQEGSAHTPEIHDSTGHYTYSRSLDVGAAHARVATTACAQMGWPVPDSCSGAAIVTFAY